MEKPKDSYIVSLDLDGTILTNEKQVSYRTIITLLKAKEQGHILVFNTARPPRDVYAMLPVAFHKDILICYNGALTLQEKKIIGCKPIEKSLMYQLVSMGKYHGYTKFAIEGCVSKCTSCANAGCSASLFANFDCERELGWIPCSYSDFSLVDFTHILKIIVYNQEPDKLITNERFVKCLPKSTETTITDKDTLIQIVSKGVTKWQGLQYIQDKYSHKKTMAFGDDNNDIQIIKNVDVGVAMENGTDKVKEAAKYITEKSNQHDGVAEFLQSFLGL